MTATTEQAHQTHEVLQASSALKKILEKTEQSPMDKLFKEVTQNLLQQGLPDAKRQERWKYSSLKSFWRPEYLSPKAINPASLTQLAQRFEPILAQRWQTENAFTLPLYNGRARLADLAPIVEEKGIDVISSDAALKHLDPSLLAHYTKTLKTLGKTDGLCAATLALSSGPIIVRITPEYKAQRPLEIIHTALNPSVDAELDTKTPFSSFQTLFIEVHPQVSFELIEQFYCAENQSGLNSNLALIHLAEGADCHHLKVFHGQQHSHQTISYSRVIQHKNSNYTCGNFSLGQGFIRNVIEPFLVGEGAQSNVNGSYLALGASHHDHRLFTDHITEHCQSRGFYKGVIGQGATAVFNGRIHIAPGARHSDGTLENRNLLLDNKSTINTKPELEIYNDDVKCSHGATVSQIDPEQLLYLRTRGLSEAEAVQLLMESYLLEPLKELSQEATKGLGAWLTLRLKKLLHQSPELLPIGLK